MLPALILCWLSLNKGAGGVPDLRMVKIKFDVVCDRGEPQLTESKNIVPIQTPKLSHFEISKIQVITVRERTLIAIPQK